MTRLGTPRRVRAAPAIPIAVLLAPSLLVILAAAERPLRIPVLLVLVAGLVLARRLGDGRTRAAWAAPVPVAVMLACALVPEPTVLGSGADCGGAVPLRVIRRSIEMSIVLAATFVAWRVGAVPASALRLRRPSPAVAAAALICFVAAAPLAVLVGPVVAAPFFGPISLRAPGVLALVPIVVAALANAVQEEVAYRGAWLGWGTLALGPAVAVGAQAAAFGLAHAGSDFTGPQLPVLVAMVAGGLAAGLIAQRTGSIALPIALHAAADVPMALYAVCG